MDDIRYYVALITLVITPQACIYWFVVHPFIGLWRRLGKGTTYTVLAVMYVAGGYLLWRIRGPLLAVEYGANPWLWPPALTFYVAAIWIQLKIKKLLTFKVLAGVPELDRSGKGGKLLDTGLYAKVRHPRYLAVTMGMVAYALFTNYLAMYVLTSLLAIGLVAIAWLEERELVERFGDDYVQYRCRVPLIIPRSSSSYERVITQKLELGASRTHVWEAITDPKKIAQWFGDNAEMDLRVGGRGAMSWKDHGRYAIQVEEVIPFRRFVWSWVHEPGVAFEEAPATRVEWELAECDNGGTVLALRETGFLTDLHYQENIKGWRHELGELEKMLSAD